MNAPVRDQDPSSSVRLGTAHATFLGLLAGVHLGVVPSVWWGNAPLPVLGARLGGILSTTMLRRLGSM